jgi:hypothetical protein
LLENLHLTDVFWKEMSVTEYTRALMPDTYGPKGRRPTCFLSIEIDTLEYQQTEKIETELEDVDRIRIRKVYACCPGWHSGGS